jgi:hypothetical protein
VQECIELSSSFIDRAQEGSAGVENQVCRAHGRQIKGQAFETLESSKSGKKVPKLKRRSRVVID